MTVNESSINFLKESFRDGVTYRELRLSTEEIDYLRKLFPKAEIKEMRNMKCSDEKVWVEVKIKEY